MNRGKCRGCGRDIVWAKSPAGSNIPLERVINVYSVDLGITGWDANPTKGEHYVSHFLTCPKANQFSGNKQPAKEAD